MADAGKPKDEAPLTDVERGLLYFFEAKGLHIKKGTDDMSDWDKAAMAAAARELAEVLSKTADTVLKSEMTRQMLGARKKLIIQ